MIASKDIRAEAGNCGAEILLDTHGKTIRVIINNVSQEFPASIVSDADIADTVQVIKEVVAHL